MRAFSIHTDHLGSTRLATDQTGAVVEKTDYDPFGKIVSHIQTGDFTERKKFTSHEFDSATNYTYAKARYLDTTAGKFLSEDPAFLLVGDPSFDNRYNRSLENFLSDPQLANSYSYARNNPMRFVDEDGESVIDDIIKSIKTWLARFSLTKQSSGFSTLKPSGVGVSAPTQKTTTWDRVTNERIKQLDPRVRQPATNFINEVESKFDIQLRVTDGVRTFEEQDKLYEQGISPARGGESYHNYGHAIDVAVMEDGRAYARPITENIARIGEAQGFEWGGRWAPPRTDPPHFEMSFGQSTRDLMINIRNR